MVVLKEYNGKTFEFQSLRDAIDELFDGEYERVRKGLYRARKKGGYYRGFKIVDVPPMPLKEDYIETEFSEFKHDKNYSSKSALVDFVIENSLLPSEVTQLHILDIKGQYISDVMDMQISDEDRSSKPIREWKERSTSDAEIRVKYEVLGVVSYATIITDPSIGGYVNIEMKEETIKTEEVKVKEGKAEQKPKFEDLGDKYIINCKGRSPMTITKDFMREFTKKYTINKLTINQMCLEFDLLRDEVHIIKTAFGITKDSIPYIDDDVDDMTADEMAEDTRIEKKRAFQRKLNTKKFDDIEKEMKRLHQKEWVLNSVIDGMKDVRPYIPFNTLNPTDPSEKIRKMIVPLADMHIGMLVKNTFNEFTLDIARERMGKITQEVIDTAILDNIDTIVIENLGDTVHGEIHDSIHKESEFGIIKQNQIAVELLRDMLATISSRGFNIEFSIVGGNHDRMNKEKSANAQDDSWHIVIREWLKAYFINDERVTFLKEASHNLVLIDMFGYCIASHHGHEGKKAEKIIASRINRGTRILEVHKGHFHQKKEISNGFLLEITFPSFCGVDSYAETNMFSGDPYVEIRVYDKDGLEYTKKINF